MKTGTKSVLFGVHNFIWHPITVARAWRHLYGSWPNWREWLCIFVHDIGYWGCDQMDDDKGEDHPVVGAKLIRWLFNEDTNPTKAACNMGVAEYKGEMYYGYSAMVLLHSRHLWRKSKCAGKPSKLCWADKFSIQFDPKWFYIFRANLTGEIEQYKGTVNRDNAVLKGIATEYNFVTDSEWYDWYRQHAENVTNEGLKQFSYLTDDEVAALPYGS